MGIVDAAMLEADDRHERRLHVKEKNRNCPGAHTTTEDGPSKYLNQSFLTTTVRPPTRHGRESVSSSEGAHSSTPSDSRKEDNAVLTGSTSRVQTTEDEFLEKLNKIRRKSLVKMNEAETNQREESKTAIIEEVLNGANNSSLTNGKTLSPPSTSGTPNTYRVTFEQADEASARVAAVDLATSADRQAKEKQSRRKKKEEKKQKSYSRDGNVTETKKIVKSEDENERRKKKNVQKRRNWKKQKGLKLAKISNTLVKVSIKLKSFQSFEAWKRSHLKPRLKQSDEAEKKMQKEETRKEAEEAFTAW
ncbi:unnamed protein product [Angiostrongylus costaricensis]|uniref:Uncharacterized protein n=1 Tax=Angiostrongylus costaricensis TaxID=334426 RepID=A0A158PFZ0_ANGCS|nr:unnamed protein product [Angiostrongylus costaricensis]